MFERFTDRARRVVVLSQEEALDLHQHLIGTEHILLAILKEDENIAAQALKAQGITLESARKVVESHSLAGTGQASKPIPFTSEGKRSLEIAFRKALQLGHNYIGAEHLLLGIADDPRVTVMLQEMGVTDVMAALLPLLGAVGPQPKTITQRLQVIDTYLDRIRTEMAAIRRDMKDE
jgi:ATP-dependent Clp protease ATP-binding subunit ClpA